MKKPKHGEDDIHNLFSVAKPKVAASVKPSFTNPLASLINPLDGDIGADSPLNDASALFGPLPRTAPTNQAGRSTRYPWWNMTFSGDRGGQPSHKDAGNFGDSLLEQRTYVAGEMLRRGLTSLPIDVLKPDSDADWSLRTYAKKPLVEKNWIDTNWISRAWHDGIPTNIMNNKVYRDYFIKALDIAYKKAYAVVEFTEKYLIDKKIPIENIPQSPSAAFNAYNPFFPETNEVGEDANEKITMQATADYLSYNNKFKKLNVGFLAYKDTTLNKTPFVIQSLETLKRFTGMPYKLNIDKKMNIPFETLKKNNELELNILPNRGGGGSFSGWKNFKSQINYGDNGHLQGGMHPDFAGDYYRNTFDHEIGHAMGMYHTMQSASNNQVATKPILNDANESIMSYSSGSIAPLLAGDIAYYQKLREIVGYPAARSAAAMRMKSAVKPAIPRKRSSKFNGGMIPEYKIGGLVSGGAGKAPTPKPKKKGILDKIQGGVNSGMNFAADGLQGVGNLVYGAAESLAASTTNPLGKLLRIPGFKNARVAGPLETSVNAVGLAFDVASLGSTTPLTAPLRTAARQGFGKLGAKILPKTATGVLKTIGKGAAKPFKALQYLGRDLYNKSLYNKITKETLKPTEYRASFADDLLEGKKIPDFIPTVTSALPNGTDRMVLELFDELDALAKLGYDDMVPPILMKGRDPTESTVAWLRALYQIKGAMPTKIDDIGEAGRWAKWFQEQLGRGFPESSYAPQIPDKDGLGIIARLGRAMSGLGDMPTDPRLIKESLEVANYDEAQRQMAYALQKKFFADRYEAMIRSLSPVINENLLRKLYPDAFWQFSGYNDFIKLNNLEKFTSPEMLMEIPQMLLPQESWSLDTLKRAFQGEFRPSLTEKLKMPEGLDEFHHIFGSQRYSQGNAVPVIDNQLAQPPRGGRSLDKFATQTQAGVFPDYVNRMSKIRMPKVNNPVSNFIRRINPFKKFNGGMIPKTPMRCGTCGKQFANGGFLRAHQHASHFNGGMMPEYKIGGLVKSGAGKKTVTKPKVSAIVKPNKVSAIVKPSFKNPTDEIFKDIPRNIGIDASLENDFPTLRESGLLRSMDPDQSYENISFKTPRDWDEKIKNPLVSNKTHFMQSIFNNRYEVARKMIQLGLTTPPLLVDASKRISDRIYRFQIDSYARKEGQKMRVDTIGKDDRTGLFQNESLRNYYKTVLEYAYPKVYATAKFTKDYLEDSSIPKDDIPDSPSHAFITNRVSWDITDMKYKQAGILRQNVEYLSDKGKMKKLNIGFPQNKPTIPSRARNFLGITDDKSTYDDHKPWLISVLEQLQRFITIPYQIFDEALNISSSDLVRQKALQLNIYPYGKKYGQSEAGGSMTPWTESKAVMMYHPWYGMNEFKNVAMHELLHALGAGHSMDEDPNGPYPHPTLLNHKYESIMNEHGYGLPSIRAGDAAFLQFLDKSMKRHLPVATEKMVRKRNIPKKFNGGMMPYGDGGPTHGPVQQGIPAILHGGEYVVRNSAVNKYGQGMLQSINQGTYKPKPYANGGLIPEYKIGGVIKGGAGKKLVDKSKLNPFSDVNYKPKSEPVKKKKKGFLGGIAGLIEDNTKVFTSTLISGISAPGELLVNATMNTLGALGVGKKQSNDSIFKKIVTNSIKETSLFQRGVALKKMITTGEDPRALMGLDRGFKGLGGYLPMQSGADAFKEQAKNRNILGKETTFTPGGALAYLGLNKVVGGLTKRISGKQADFTKEGSGAYGITQIAGDILADTLASPGGGKSVANIAKLPFKSLQKLNYSIQDQIRFLKQSGLTRFSPERTIMQMPQIPGAPRTPSRYRPQVLFDHAEYVKKHNDRIAKGLNDPNNAFESGILPSPYYNFLEEAGAYKYAREFRGYSKIDAPTIPRMLGRKIFGKPIESVKKIKTKFQDFLVPPKTVSGIGNVAGDDIMEAKAFLAAKKKAEYDAMVARVHKETQEFLATMAIKKRVKGNLEEFSKGTRASGFKAYTEGLEEIAKRPYIAQAQGFGLKAEDLESFIAHPQFVTMMKTMKPAAIRKAINAKFGIVHRGSGVDNTMGIGNHRFSVYRPNTIQNPDGTPLQAGVDIGDDADFSFYVEMIRDAFGNPLKDASGQAMRRIDISEMYSTGGLAGQKDMMRMLAYIFDEIIVKHNVVSISNSSFSKHSLALAKTFAEITKVLRPKTKINFPEIQLGTSLNGIEMSEDVWRMTGQLEPATFDDFFSGSGIGILEGGRANLINVASTAGQRARIEQLVQIFMKTARKLKNSGVDMPSSKTIEEIAHGMPTIPNPTRTPTYNAGDMFDADIAEMRIDQQQYLDSLRPLTLSESLRPLTLPELPELLPTNPRRSLDEIFEDIENAIARYNAGRQNPQQFLDALPGTPIDEIWGGGYGLANGGLIPYAKGGRMKYGNGGPTFGPMNIGIPATLHGGEYVIRKKAVDKYGMDMLSKINEGLYAPKVPSLKMPMANYSKIATAGPSQQMMTSESNHNYNFYVDNFIGETEWFNTMMKEYNVKVVPANQKQAGLESRVVKSYNGINRGM